MASYIHVNQSPERYLDRFRAHEHDQQTDAQIENATPAAIGRI